MTLRACVVALSLWLAMRSVHADPAIRRPKSAAALEHLDKAGKLYGVQSFEQAAEEYKQGALVEPAPVFDYDLGQCYRQLHRYKDAIWYYQRFINESPETPEHDDNVQKLIAAMQSELDQRAMTAPPTDAATTAPTKPVVETRPQPSPPVAPVRDDGEAWYADGFGWGLAGAGVVALGVATGLFIDASSLNDQANHTADQSTANTLHNSADTRTLTGTIIGVGGGALLVTGVIKLAIHGHSARVNTAWSVSVSSRDVWVSLPF